MRRWSRPRWVSRTRPAAIALMTLAALAAACSASSSLAPPTPSAPESPAASATPTAPASVAPASVAPASVAPASATPGPALSAVPEPTLTPPPTSKPTKAPGPVACTAAQLAAKITLWEGAMGHRIAHVQLQNRTTNVTCTVRVMDRPQLVDGSGIALIDSAAPTSTPHLTLGPGGLLKTLVQDGNYCGPAPVAPVTVAFVLAGTLGRLVATPISPTDTSGVPPCLGDPGSAGSIEMQAWAP